MYKKLDDGAINAILETGIEEFADKGPERANINVIAKRAGVSVGVIYKYFGDKNGFFLACVRYSLRSLDEVLERAASNAGDTEAGVRAIVSALISHAAEHPSHIVMYNEISSGGCKAYATELAREIEGKTAKVYSALLGKARDEGRADPKLDPALTAFFLDNLFMMLQFSYSCDYYRERMKIFCGESAEDSEKITEGIMRFIKQALQIKDMGEEEECM